jgi:septal ring factor EnvC (AmiA/AmiB activator)
MQELSDDDRKAILGEVLMGELAAIREYVADIPAIKQDLAQLKGDVKELKDDMKIVKAAVTEHSVQLHDHERRIIRLEAKPT